MSSGSAARRKGLNGEREVADAFTAAGWHVRGLEGGGDHFAARLTGLAPNEQRRLLHLECKRQERLALPAWLKQARDEAPPGVPPVVAFRQNRGVWYAALPLSDLLELLA